MILVHIQKMYNIFRKLIGVWSSGIQQYFFYYYFFFNEEEAIPPPPLGRAQNSEFRITVVVSP